MRKVKVLVHIADWNATDLDRQTVRAEVVARFGKHQSTMRGYDAVKDEEIQVELKFKDWWTNDEVHRAFISMRMLRIALSRIEIFPIKKS